MLKSGNKFKGFVIGSEDGKNFGEALYTRANSDEVSRDPKYEFPTMDSEYIKLNEVALPDGKTKMIFLAKKPNDVDKTFDEVMNEIYNLASESLIRKLSK
jgi:hypothetical protein